MSTIDRIVNDETAALTASSGGAAAASEAARTPTGTSASDIAAIAVRGEQRSAIVNTAIATPTTGP